MGRFAAPVPDNRTEKRAAPRHNTRVNITLDIVGRNATDIRTPGLRHSRNVRIFDQTKIGLPIPNGPADMLRAGFFQELRAAVIRQLHERADIGRLFRGMLVLDYEKAYPSPWRDSRHWPLFVTACLAMPERAHITDAEFDAYAHMEWVTLVSRYVRTILAAARAACKGAKVYCYGYPDAPTWPLAHASRPEMQRPLALSATGDRLSAEIIESLDGLTPALYMPAAATGDMYRIMRARIADAKTSDPGRPVLAYLWYILHGTPQDRDTGNDGTLIGLDDFDGCVRACKDEDVDLCLWGHVNTSAEAVRVNAWMRAVGLPVLKKYHKPPPGKAAISD